mgnify:CR=1 FL=1
MPSLIDVMTVPSGSETFGRFPSRLFLDYVTNNELRRLWEPSLMKQIGWGPSNDTPSDASSDDSGHRLTEYTDTCAFGSDITPPWTSESNGTYLSEESFSTMSHDVGQGR